MISLVIDRRTHLDNLYPPPNGRVRPPTYGVVIKSPIRQLIKVSNIKVVCLKQRDFYNVLWAHGGIDGVSADEFGREGTWLGFADLINSAAYLNATGLATYPQIDVDYVVLHELSHILLNITDEKETNRGAIELAKQLQLPIPEVDANFSPVWGYKARRDRVARKPQKTRKETSAYE